jgi:hypothetical protein
LSSTLDRWTQPIVQYGAHGLTVSNSRAMSSRVYVASGTPG